MSWGSRAWIKHVPLLWRGVPAEHHHDCVLFGKGCRVVLDGGLRIGTPWL
jgi:hypothetical protein